MQRFPLLPVWVHCFSQLTICVCVYNFSFLLSGLGVVSSISFGSWVDESFRHSRGIFRGRIDCIASAARINRTDKTASRGLT